MLFVELSKTLHLPAIPWVHRHLKHNEELTDTEEYAHGLYCLGMLLACNPLSKRKEKEYVRTIVRALRRAEAPVTLDHALEALGEIGSLLALADVLPYLDHDDENVRYSARYAVGQIAARHCQDRLLFDGESGCLPGSWPPEDPPYLRKDREPHS